MLLKQKLSLFSVVAPLYPKLWFNSQEIKFVDRFKYLGVYISVRLGWDKYINERLKIITKVHTAMKTTFRTIGKKEMKIRKKIFLCICPPALHMALYNLVLFYGKTERED